MKEKISSTLLYSLESTIHRRILVKLKDPEEYIEAAAIAAGEHKTNSRSKHEQIEKLKHSSSLCQENCCKFLTQQLEEDTKRLSKLGINLRGTSHLSRMKNFWINNSIIVDASYDLILNLAQRDDIEYIKEVKQEEPIKDFPGLALNEANNTWGLNRLRIPEIWARGFKGEGIKIGHLDTGIDGTHPDLIGKLEKFAIVDFDANLYELDLTQDIPFDTGEHGTHTAGTIVGGNQSGTAIGVAPQAKLYSGLVIEGGQVLDRVLRGMQWIAEQSDVSIISMSLGFPPGEAFENDFETAINNLVALDIFPAIAIGNEGVGTLRAPGINLRSWSVGASNRQNQIARFSGGKALNRSLDRIQPDMVAPGVDILSSVPGGKYASFSGSSMATPHLAGVVALLRQANQNATVNEIKQVLAETALDLGRVGDDIRFGWGLVQPIAALETLR